MANDDKELLYAISYNQNAELSVTGAYLIDPHYLNRVAGTLQAEDFMNPLCAKLYTAATKAFREGKVLDPVMARDVILHATPPRCLSCRLHEYVPISFRRGRSRRIHTRSSKGTAASVEDRRSPHLPVRGWSGRGNRRNMSGLHKRQTRTEPHNGADAEQAHGFLVGSPCEPC